jgi:hypothetical protein
VQAPDPLEGERSQRRLVARLAQPERSRHLFPGLARSPHQGGGVRP